MVDIKKFLNEEQNPKAVERVMAKLSTILTSGEEVEYIAVQKKPVVTLSPDCIALTNKRVIFFRQANFGLSFNFNDMVWKDVVDCHYSEEVLGAVFTVRGVNGWFLKIDYLPKNQARKVYAMAQDKEEEQREYRRQIALENKRAGAGNINLGAFPVQPPVEQPKAEDPVEILQKLKSLLDSGILSQEEFDKKKAEIIAKM